MPDRGRPSSTRRAWSTPCAATSTSRRPPTSSTTSCARLGLEPWDIARAKEAKEAGIDLPRDAGHRGEWLSALAAHPRVIQRPIITAADGTTVVGRDADSLARVIEAD